MRRHERPAALLLVIALLANCVAIYANTREDDLRAVLFAVIVSGVCCLIALAIHPRR